MKTLTSKIDKTVNFIVNHRDGKLESRYVKRRKDDFTCYLSSHNGCNKGCKFCWLTQTKQITFHPATLLDIVNQAKPVLEHASKDETNKQVNFSFMSRGEPLSNPNIQQYWPEISNALYLEARKYGFIPTFNISTIMPKDANMSLREVFSVNCPTIYYSLYSIDPEFKREWMPGAMWEFRALRLLQDYQEFSQKIIKIHGALIEGQNDDLSEWIEIMNYIDAIGLRIKVQFVRYNPKDESKESNVFDFIEKLRYNTSQPVSVVDRVGQDVYGSCGMFDYE